MPHVEISIDEEGLVNIQTNYVDRFRIKELPGATYNGTTWRAPLTWSTCVTLRGLFGSELTIGPDLTRWAYGERETRIVPATKLRLATEIPQEFIDTPAAKVIISWRGTRTDADDKPLDLKPFQEAGVLYLYHAVSAGLGDPMGSGKTTQAIHLLRLLRELDLDPFPTLIVATNTIKRVWEEELHLWAPEIDFQVVSGNVSQRREQLVSPAQVNIMNWEALRLHSRLAAYGSYALRGCRVCDKDLLTVHDEALQKLDDLKARLEKEPEDEELLERLPVLAKAYKDAKRSSEHGTCERCPRELNKVRWRTVIADEAHHALAPRSRQTRALWAAARDAVRRVWMTGTPIDGRLDELWSPLHYMEPREWPSKTRYISRWTVREFNIWGGMEVLGIKSDTRDEFFKIFDPRFRRLPKDIILPNLPPLTMLPVRQVEMSPKQAKAYKQMLDHLMAELEDGLLLAAPNPLTRTLRLLQFASSHATVTGSGDVELSLPSNKVDFLEDALNELRDEQVVVFTVAPDLVKMAAERLKKMRIEHATIIGEVSLDDRYAAVRDFQAGNLQVVLANMQTGSEGITLTAAPVLIRLQRHWRNLYNLQSIDRIHRIGSERHDKIRIIDAVTPGTIEVSQLAVLAGKFGRMQEVTRDKEAMMMILRGEVPGDSLVEAG